MNEKIEELRKLVFDEMKRLLKGRRSYEGKVSIIYPGYSDNQNGYGVILVCDLIGPRHHNSWWGSSHDEVLDRALDDIKQWIKENNVTAD